MTGTENASHHADGGVGHRILRAGMAVGIAHILFKLVGLAQAIAVGRWLDNETYDVVYAFAFEGVIFGIFLLGEEIIGPAFLPVFMRERDTRDEEAAWTFANIVLTAQCLILLTVVTLLWLFPDTVIALLTSWDPVRDAERFAQARQALRWLSPALIAASLGSTTYMLLNGYKRFFLAAFGDASWKLCILASTVLGMGAFGLDHRAVLFGVLVGSIAKLATHLLGLLDHLRRFRPRLSGNGAAVRALLWLMLPLLAGIVFAKARDLFNNVTILSWLDTPGLMKANSFGRKLLVAVGWLVPYALSIAMFPFFCEMVDRKDREGFGRILTQSCRMLLCVFLPVAAVFAVLARPIALFLFRGGAFTTEAAEWTAVSTACYVLALPATAVEYLLMQAFFAHRRMVAVIVAGLVFSALSIAISAAAIRGFGLGGTAALAAVALGFSLCRTLKSIALVALLKRNLPVLPTGDTLAFLARAGLAALVAAAAAALVAQALAGRVPDSRIGLLVELLAAGAAAGVAWIAAIAALRVQEPREMLAWALQRRRGKPRSAASPGGRPDA